MDENRTLLGGALKFEGIQKVTNNCLGPVLLGNTDYRLCSTPVLPQRQSPCLLAEKKYNN
jgi:hypothetical protein